MKGEPEELYKGTAGGKSSFQKHQDLIEKEEMDAFKRITFSKADKKAMGKKKTDEFEHGLLTLDDDMKAIDTIIKRTSRKDKNSVESQAKAEGANSNFQKSLKSFMSKDKPQAKKRKFADLKADGVKGDAVYEGQKDKLREKKAARKEVEKDTKVRKTQEVENMGNDIQRNISRDMLKAKGLTRKRKIEDRTPRVKKRHAYEKLVKKHSHRVTEVKAGPQGLYAGQKDGLRAGVSRGTKLN